MKPILTTLPVVRVAKFAFDALGGCNERVTIMNDRDLLLRVSLDPEVGFLGRLTCLHRVHADSRSAKIQAEEPDYLQVIEEINLVDPSLRSKVGKFKFRSRLFRGYIRVAKYYASLGDRVAANDACHRARRWAWGRPGADWRVR